MNRLNHSFEAYHNKIRRLSPDNRLFVFVEGKINDPYFYGEICRSVCQKVNYTIRQAREIPGETGGKPALIAFFRFIKENSGLINEFEGKKTGVIFFLDKDVDDLVGKLCHSEHIVYTKYYDVENHIVVEGNLAKAAAGAASMDYQQVISGIDNYENWRYQVAEKWKDWVKLCLFARIQDIGCECTYSHLSKINQPLYGQLDSTVYAKYLQILKVRSKLSEEQFAKAFEKVSNQVDDLYAAGEYDRVFKGKWYAGFLEAEIKIIAGNHHFHSKTLAVRIITALTMTLNFEANWVEYFNKPLRELVEKF